MNNVQGGSRETARGRVLASNFAAACVSRRWGRLRRRVRPARARLGAVALGHVAEALDERLLRAREVAVLELGDDGVLVGREVAAGEQAVEVLLGELGGHRELRRDDDAGVHVDLAHDAEDRVHLAADGVGRRLGVPDEDAGAHGRAILPRRSARVTLTTCTRAMTADVHEAEEEHHPEQRMQSATDAGPHRSRGEPGGHEQQREPRPRRTGAGRARAGRRPS